MMERLEEEVQEGAGGGLIPCRPRGSYSSGTIP